MKTKQTNRHEEEYWICEWNGTSEPAEFLQNSSDLEALEHELDHLHVFSGDRLQLSVELGNRLQYLQLFTFTRELKMFVASALVRISILLRANHYSLFTHFILKAF